jgi:hypothetical protein
MTARERPVTWDGVRQNIVVWECYEGKAGKKEPLTFWRYRTSSFEEAMMWVWYSRVYYNTPRQLSWEKCMHVMAYNRSCTPFAAMAAHCQRYNEMAENIEMSFHDRPEARTCILLSQVYPGQ